ncbi:MAG TPA: regulatory iron-sulfur-containing complex subunit RicT [Candidatus Binatia bacterium]|nr:regulatory iron-sulfur-containing complex subunit RicT [Candidatus Binatia bacterium]
MAEHSTEPQGAAVGVRFRPAGPVHRCDPGPLALARDDRVIVETEHGPVLGTVAVAVWPHAGGALAGRVLKKADARDLAREDRGLQREREQQRAALEIARRHRLAAKLVKVEGSADGSRLTVFLAADERLDLRDLGRDLAEHLRLRVEVKQIGARDEAKVAGGVGVCGRELCCSSWLREFQAVTVKMVKEQGLSLNPSKLAGQCGRLKCCLRYEYQTYQELRRALPAVGARVESVRGSGKVLRQNILKQTVVVLRDEDGVEAEATLDDLVVKRADA